jgi:hypothetical protein
VDRDEHEWRAMVRDAGHLRKRARRAELSAGDGGARDSVCGAASLSAAPNVPDTGPRARHPGTPIDRRRPDAFAEDAMMPGAGRRVRTGWRCGGERMRGRRSVGWLLVAACALACSEASSGAAPAESTRDAARFAATAGRPPSFAGALQPDLQALPDDVPSFPGAQWYIGGRARTGDLTSGFVTREPSVDVYVYYRRALVAHGWEVVEDAGERERFRLVARKANRRLSFAVGPGPDGSELSITTGRL